MSFPFFPKKSFYHRRKPMCIGSDKFLSGSLTHELTFRMYWNNIEGATSPAWCELPHQCIYKQCITGKFASRPPDHPGRHSGLPGWFIGRIWRPYLCSTDNSSAVQASRAGVLKLGTHSTRVLNFWYSYFTRTREFQSNSTRTRGQVLRYSYE